MTILTRIVRLWKADVHGVMDQMEDKELLVKQYLREMEGELQRKKIMLRQLAESLRQTEKSVTVREEEIDKIENDLQLALRKENDQIARALIRRLRIQDKQCRQLADQVEKNIDEKDQLSQLIEKQQAQYEALKVRAAGFCRQAQMNRFTAAEDFFERACDSFSVDDDEVELELMRRKEAMTAKGGAS